MSPARGAGPARSPASRVVGARPALPGSSRWPRDRARLAREAACLARRPVRLEVEALSDPDIRRVNRRFLGHDWATDVVSFPLSAPGASVLVGALAVSVDTARREAALRGHSPYHEWMLYVVHGTLHLLGHDDRAPRARARMRRAERRLLGALGLPPSLFEARGPAGGGHGRTRAAGPREAR